MTKPTGWTKLIGSMDGPYVFSVHDEPGAIIEAGSVFPLFRILDAGLVSGELKIHTIRGVAQSRGKQKKSIIIARVVVVDAEGNEIEIYRQAMSEQQAADMAQAQDRSIVPGMACVVCGEPVSKENCEHTRHGPAHIMCAEELNDGEQ